jgi:hypothetical protein
LFKVIRVALEFCEVIHELPNGPSAANSMHGNGSLLNVRERPLHVYACSHLSAVEVQVCAQRGFGCVELSKQGLALGFPIVGFGRVHNCSFESG